MPRQGNWWIATQGLLTSGNDPTPELTQAGDAFPDEYLPMVYMTGDGHRDPPFNWTNNGIWGTFWTDIVQQNKICCHVETYANRVTAQSVPLNLRPVQLNGKVFGWEPEFYKIVQDVMEELPILILKDCLSLNDIHYITREMFRISNLGYLGAEGNEAMEFFDRARVLARMGRMLPCPTDEPILKTGLFSLQGHDFNTFLRNYLTRTYWLRTAINNVIGANIQRVINLYPDHVHLITCGDAHITNNPLYNFVRPPLGTFGTADQSRG